ncbi:MAG: hypothetical protein QF491_24395, partial [Alphaproteobacteria bacterium]|nr:hypothetical protein [Alphaproteobacteria bacterium]
MKRTVFLAVWWSREQTRNFAEAMPLYCDRILPSTKIWACARFTKCSVARCLWLLGEVPSLPGEVDQCCLFVGHFAVGG